MATVVTNDPRGAYRRFVKAIEPWYDWGNTFIERMDDESEGPGRFVSVQWLGISFTLFFGRIPKRRGL
jgi:hypothetical protein